MTRFVLFILILLLFSETGSAQTYKVEGRVINRAGGKALSYANIRVSGSLKGTSANSDGNFQINLEKGKNLLIASCIGFISDSVEVQVGSDIPRLEILLDPINIQLPEVTIIPGRNPALDIIEGALRRKHARASMLKS
ncbi:MAG: carboxypeptidase-like regulatory domain-containing protein, partial [Syntrophothermus sp.]